MNKLLLCFAMIAMILLTSSLSSAALLIQEPSFGEEFAFDTTPQISWEGCEEESYLLQIARDALFDDVVFQQVVSESSYELEVELDPQKYFLIVNGISESGDFSCISPTSEFEIKELSPLSFFFDESRYESEGLLRIEMNGPLDARVEIEITGDDFFLPILLEDLSKPDFELELTQGIYTFLATSQYADGELSATQEITLGTPQVQNTNEDDNQEESQEDGLYNFTITVKEFEGEGLEGIEIDIRNDTNRTVETNESGSISLLLSEDEYELFFEEEGYVDDDEEVYVDEEMNFTFFVIPDDLDDLDDEDDEDDDEEESSSSQELPKIDFKLLEESAYATTLVPLSFTLEGSASRCQVLIKNPDQPGYEIAQTILPPSSSNEVILTQLAPGEIQLRIRCIVSDDEAAVSQTQTITLIDIESDKEILQVAIDEATQTLNKINNFPLSFKQIFIDDVLELETYISTATELIKKISASDDILQVQTQIRELNEKTTDSFLKTIEVNNSNNVISYGSLDDAKIVVEYLDLAKSPKQLVDEQEQFAIKTNYNFVTLTYASGLIVKQTFVSNQILTVQGVDNDISYEQYYVMPNFLTARLASTNDVVKKEYDKGSLVRVLDNASALIFDGWLEDSTLVKTIVLADSSSFGSSPTGFVVASSDAPTWRIPLISFIVILILAGLFFNPYFSIMNAFEKNSLQIFASQVHHCIDASLAQDHQKVIQMIPHILQIHEKMSKDEQGQTTEIIDQVRELFYDSTYQITLKKISTKDPTLWTYDELEVAIKDFYGSYAKLSPAKQRVYLTYYNQMLHYCQDLLTKVKK